MPLEKKKTCSTHQTGENSRLNQCAKNDKSGETFGKKVFFPPSKKWRNISYIKCQNNNVLIDLPWWNRPYFSAEIIIWWNSPWRIFSGPRPSVGVAAVGALDSPSTAPAVQRRKRMNEIEVYSWEDHLLSLNISAYIYMIMSLFRIDICSDFGIRTSSWFYLNL